jgi:transcriptional regulator with XRE-family HTH domain
MWLSGPGRPGSLSRVHEGSATAEELGRALRALREQRGESLETVANAVGISRNYLNLIELGKCNPSLAMLAGLANLYGLRLSQLFARAEDGADGGAPG